MVIKSLFKKTQSQSQELSKWDEKETQNLKEMGYQLDYTVMLLPEASQRIAAYLAHPQHAYQAHVESHLDLSKMAAHFRIVNKKVKNLGQLDSFLTNMTTYFSEMMGLRSSVRAPSSRFAEIESFLMHMQLEDIEKELKRDLLIYEVTEDKEFTLAILGLAKNNLYISER